jgi:hypothetical protein
MNDRKGNTVGMKILRVTTAGWLLNYSGAFVILAWLSK